jgi:hypothetical protein
VVRVTRTIIRPGRRDGGTTLVFKLKRPAVLRFTVVRIYPSCKRVGSFTVRGRRGVNRVPFRGRLRGGRPLPDGTYQLRVRPRGGRVDVAAVTVVIVNGKRMSAAEIRKARAANVCQSSGIAISATAGSADVAGGNGGPNRVAAVISRAKSGIAETAEAFVTGVKELPGRLGAAAEDPRSDPWALVLVGLLTLAASAVGLLVLTYAVRASGLNDRTAR